MNEPKKDIEFEAEAIVGKVKELVKKGNIARITVKKESETVVSLPVNASIVGAAITAAAAPWALLDAAIVTVGLDCIVELQKTDGGIIDISGKRIGQKAADVGTSIIEDAASGFNDACQGKKPEGTPNSDG